MTTLSAPELDQGRSMGRPQPMRVMLVGPLPPPSGGMANQTRQLAQLLAGEGLTVEVVRTNAPYVPAWIGRVRGLRAIVRLVPYLCRLFAAAGRADVAHVMANSGWAWHLFAAPAVWTARARGAAVVINYRGGEADAFLARQLRWVRPTLERAAAVVVPSGFLAEIFARRGIATRTVPNIVNLDLFGPADVATGVAPDVADGTASAGAPHILVTRNLEPIYDIGTAIRAVAIVRDSVPSVRLTVAGTGPSLAELQRLAVELQMSACVRFIGRVENTQLPALYRSAQVALNSSLVDNMPISVLEALASGVPVVSTDVGGVPYLVENERTALLVPPRDPAAMAAALLRIVQDPNLARRLARAGRAESLRYAWTEVRGRILAVYEDVRGKPARPPLALHRGDS